MENPVNSALGNYRVDIIGLWNILYAIQLWFNVAFEGFSMVLTMGWWTMENRREIDYSSVGFVFMGSGGQGVTLNSYGEAWERNLKCDVVI